LPEVELDIVQEDPAERALEPNVLEPRQPQVLQEQLGALDSLDHPAGDHPCADERKGEVASGVLGSDGDHLERSAEGPQQECKYGNLAIGGEHRVMYCGNLKALA
jgi:hypothetical protein